MASDKQRPDDFVAGSWPMLPGQLGHNHRNLVRWTAPCPRPPTFSWSFHNKAIKKLSKTSFKTEFSSQAQNSSYSQTLSNPDFKTTSQNQNLSFKTQFQQSFHDNLSTQSTHHFKATSMLPQQNRFEDDAHSTHSQKDFQQVSSNKSGARCPSKNFNENFCTLVRKISLKTGYLLQSIHRMVQTFLQMLFQTNEIISFERSAFCNQWYWSTQVEGMCVIVFVLPIQYITFTLKFSLDSSNVNSGQFRI